MKKRGFVTEDLKYLIYRKQCMDCGKHFDARINAQSGKVMDGTRYWGRMTFGIGNWGKYRWEGLTSDGKPKLKRCISYQRELFYRMIDLKRRLRHQYREVEMWSCPRCGKKEREQWRRKEKKNAQHSIGQTVVQTTEST